VVSVGGVRDYTIEWPADVETECGNMPVFEEVTAVETGCDLLVTTVETDTFFATSLECFRLRRTIEVFNFCEYNGIDEAYNIPRDADQDGNFLEPTFLHVIPGNNTSLLDDQAILDVDMNRNNNNSIRALDIDDNFGFTVDSDNDGDTGYANSLSRGYFRYVQFVSVIDNTAPSVDNITTTVIDDDDCSGGAVTIDYTVEDECVMTTVTSSAFLDLNYNATIGFSPDREINDGELTSDGMGGFTINISGLEPGTHAVRMNGMDGCGNWDGRIATFSIADGSGIAPICIGTLTYVLMPDGAGGGMAAITADEYVIDVNGNCGGGEIRYSVYREEGEADQPGFVPEPGRTQLLVTCDDEGTLPVRVYVFSENGSFGLCSAFAEVEAFNENVCTIGGLGSLAGFITTPLNDLLPDVEIHISDMAQMNDMQYTDENGSFLFPGLEEGGNYMITPAMGNMVNLQRVKTSDINRIMNHIMGINPFENPYLMVAADVDADGFITVGDMVSIRRAILGLDDTYVNGPTFRFIQRDFDLEGLTEGWDPDMFPATYTVEPLEGHNREADFVAIEIGDVYIDASGRESLALETTDELLSAGETYELTLTAGELTGFQGTIEAAAGLDITSWSSELLGTANVNETLLSEGVLALSYNDQVDLHGEEIITLQLIAREDLRISDYLSVTNRTTYPEAITTSGASADLTISYGETTGGAGIVLHQNFPNPVAAQTTIEFDLPTAETVLLEVHDLQGRLLSARTIAAFAGRNLVTLNSDNDLKNMTGVLTYTLVVGQERLTKRMT
ncbi:MAG: T9SS type A sorting domain-containing protein, partial [Bacteroidota bacterium]